MKGLYKLTDFDTPFRAEDIHDYLFTLTIGEICSTVNIALLGGGVGGRGTGLPINLTV